jgi:hypothetical protein
MSEIPLPPGAAWELGLAAYDYARGYNGRAYAWEFSRRNKGYCRDFLSYARDGVEPIQRVAGRTLLRQNAPQHRAEAWGLRVYVDPAIAAGEAFVFWTQDAEHAQLRGRAVTNTADWDGRPAAALRSRALIDLDGFRVPTAMLVEHTGETHLLVLAPPGAVQIAIGNLEPGVQSVYLDLERPLFDHFMKRVELARVLYRAYVSKGIFPAHQESQKMHRFRKTLLAIDGHQAGASVRDIAKALVGARRTDAAWRSSNRSLKDQVRRLIAKGCYLRDGGYFDLLR